MCGRFLTLFLQYNVTFFGMGGCKVCAWDFRPGTTEVMPVRQTWIERCRFMLQRINSLRSPRTNSEFHRASHVESDISLVALESQDLPPVLPLQDEILEESKLQPSVNALSSRTVPVPEICRYRSHQDVVHTVQSLQDTIQLASASSTPYQSRAIIPGREYDVPENAVPRLRDFAEAMVREENSSGPVSSRRRMSEIASQPKALPVDPEEVDLAKDCRTWYTTPLNIIKLILTPPSISLFLALPISLVQPLKAMFVHVEGWTGGRMPNGPDGKPPLSWLLDVSTLSIIVAAWMANRLFLDVLDGKLLGSDLHPVRADPVGLVFRAAEIAQTSIQIANCRYRGELVCQSVLQETCERTDSRSTARPSPWRKVYVLRLFIES